MNPLLEKMIEDANKLRSIDFTVGGEMQTFYYKLLTGKTYDTIKTLSKKIKIVESQEVEYIDDNLLRANTIVKQSLNEKGEHVFGITDVENILKIPYDTQCYLASVMGLKSISDIIEEAKEALKKTKNQEP